MVSTDNGVDYAELIAEMEKAEGAPEPGNFVPFRDIIHKGDEGLPVDVITHSLKSAGYVFVYHMETGERRAVNSNMLPMILRKTLDNGTRAFSTKPIANPPHPIIKGKLKCWLHKNGEYRELADKWGFPYCIAGSIKSPMDVESHMKHRHKAEYAAIMKSKEEKKEEEEREWRKALVDLARPSPVGRPKKVESE